MSHLFGELMLLDLSNPPPPFFVGVSSLPMSQLYFLVIQQGTVPNVVIGWGVPDQKWRSTQNEKSS